MRTFPLLSHSVFRCAATRSGLLLAILFSYGCATAPDRNLAYSHFKTGNYKQAETAIAQVMKPEGKNALLYYLDIGLIRHLDKNYQGSNQAFHKAEKLVESFYTKSVGGSVAGAFMAGAQSRYEGFEFEHVLINYYKALNYIGQAQMHPKRKQEFLDKANVEIRRLDNRLKLIQERYGDYKDESEEGGIKGIFSSIFGEKINRDKLLYRNDAFAQYVSGLIYELNNDPDNARVSFQRSAKTYEKGFSDQYQLGKEIAEQAWLDTLRIMKISGGYEDQIPNYVEKKLTNNSANLLQQTKKSDAELTILQHLGVAPERGQLNLQLTAQPWSRSLVLQPVPVGTIQEQRAQEAWFKMLYADQGLFDAIQNFASGGLLNVIVGQFTKVYPLGPLWGEAERTGLVDAINDLGGVRIAVPYYKTDQTPFGETEVWLNGKRVKSLLPATSIQKIAYQEQLRNANRQIQQEVLQESLKAVAAYKAKQKAEEQGGAFAGALAGLALKGLQTAAASTDTRNWNTLPAEIRLGRIPLEPGENRIELITHRRNGSKVKQTYIVNSQQGNQIWDIRTLSTSMPKTHYAANAKPAAASSGTMLAVTAVADNSLTRASSNATPVPPPKPVSRPLPATRSTTTPVAAATEAVPASAPAVTSAAPATPTPSAFSPAPTPASTSSVPVPAPAPSSAPAPMVSAPQPTPPVSSPNPAPVAGPVVAPVVTPVVAPVAAPSPVSVPDAPQSLSNSPATPSPDSMPTAAPSLAPQTVTSENPLPASPSITLAPLPIASPLPLSGEAANVAVTAGNNEPEPANPQNSLDAAREKAEQLRQKKQAEEARARARALANGNQPINDGEEPSANADIEPSAKQDKEPSADGDKTTSAAKEEKQQPSGSLEDATPLPLF